MSPSPARRLAAEAIGTALLFATVIGSGIMAERLASGNVGLALLANSVATGAMLYVLISLLGPVSGAHFNPAVTLVMALRRSLTGPEALLVILVQCTAGLVAVWLTHAMFDLPLVQIGIKPRTGGGQWLGEMVATFGLVLTILGTVRCAPTRVPAAVALYITGAYWFTSSTSFANPAITLARALTDSFSGILPAHAPAFVAAQLGGAMLALATASWLFRDCCKAAIPPG